ncbi:hypothetical protein APB26_32700 [Pseudomonas aeruginosa]|nr:hypothetical protein APB26_32700 [Pseudomonas aeruginosa]RPV61416.1 hypothetical protein IPC838_19040 [Pseudomonas aeruginosa]
MAPDVPDTCLSPFLIGGFSGCRCRLCRVAGSLRLYVEVVEVVLPLIISLILMRDSVANWLETAFQAITAGRIQRVGGD